MIFKTHYKKKDITVKIQNILNAQNPPQITIEDQTKSITKLIWFFIGNGFLTAFVMVSIAFIDPRLIAFALPSSMFASIILFYFSFIYKHLSVFNHKLWVGMVALALVSIVVTVGKGFYYGLDSVGDVFIGSLNLFIALICGATAVYGNERSELSIKAKVWVVITYLYSGIVGVVCLYLPMIPKVKEWTIAYKTTFTIVTLVVVLIAIVDLVKGLYDYSRNTSNKISQYEVFSLVLLVGVVVFNYITYSYWNDVYSYFLSTLLIPTMTWLTDLFPILQEKFLISKEIIEQFIR